MSTHEIKVILHTVIQVVRLTRYSFYNVTGCVFCIAFTLRSNRIIAGNRFITTSSERGIGFLFM